MDAEIAAVLSEVDKIYLHKDERRMAEKVFLYT